MALVQRFDILKMDGKKGSHTANFIHHDFPFTMIDFLLHMHDSCHLCLRLLHSRLNRNPVVSLRILYLHLF
jgi:hypothetical protein